MQNKTNEILTESIRRMRNGQVHIEEGFDGEYGKIRTFTRDEIKNLQNQEALFSDFTEEIKAPAPKPLINFDIASFQKLYTKKEEPKLFIPKEEKRFLNKLLLIISNNSTKIKNLQFSTIRDRCSFWLDLVQAKQEHLLRALLISSNSEVSNRQIFWQ